MLPALVICLLMGFGVLLVSLASNGWQKRKGNNRDEGSRDETWRQCIRLDR